MGHNPSLQILALILMSGAWSSGAAAQGPGNDDSAVSSGTLNLVLANKNGFVIAADSRRSNPTMTFDCNGIQQRYCDDSQKLFRTSDGSAMAIAGFAGVARGTPLDFVMADVLRGRFGPCGHRILEQSLDDGRFTIRCASEVGGLSGVPTDSSWSKDSLVPPLTLVASVYNVPPNGMKFSALFAGINQDHSVVLRWQQFSGAWISSGPRTADIPSYDVQQSPILTVQDFTRVSAGIQCVANAILEGYYKSDDPVIVRYYSKRNDQAALNSMSLAEMAELARVILRETKKFTDYVGGADQIGVFPVNGEPQWNMPALPIEKELTPRFTFNRCVSYSKGAPPMNGPCARGTYVEDWQHSLDEVIAQFYLGSQFTGVSVSLDYNYFVRSRFDGVTFKYNGKTFVDSGNTYSNCKVEFPAGVVLPNSEVFNHCEKVKQKTVALDDDTIGKPLQWQKRGTQMVLPIPNP